MNYDFQHRDQIEDAILGAILIDNRKSIRDLVRKHKLDSPLCFRTKFNQDVFEAILKVWDNGFEVDLITVVNFRSDDYRDSQHLNWCNGFDINCITMTQKIASSAHLEHHILLLKQYLLIDFWNSKAEDILNSRWEFRDVFIVGENIIDGYNLLVEQLASGSKKENSSLKDAARLKFERKQNGELTSVPIGISDIDLFTGGWQDGELTIIGARPGMGKTTVSLICATKTAFNYNRRGAFISLEMSKAQLMNKIIAEKLGLDYQDIKNFRISKEDFDKVLWWYDFFENESPLRIYDINDCRTLGDIERIISEENLEYVFIDYLQLIKLNKAIQKNGNREQEVGEISRTLKLLALEKQIPIIALSQLSRSCESRNNKRPLLSDLRESGSLEQDADNVVFYYREAYYQEKAGQTVPEVEQGNLEWIMAKGRETGTKAFYINVNFKTNEISSEFKFNGILPPPPPVL